MAGGMGGMGGMGGGLMGSLMRSAMGGMNRGPGGSQPSARDTSDVYDVDRWKRADDLDSTATMVQAVRSDWERKEAERDARSLKKKAKTLLKRLSRKQADRAETPETQTPKPVGGTIVTPEMKKASHRIHVTADGETAPVPAAEMQDRLVGKRENYLGLHFQTGLDGFFTANPVNSAILAADRLGLGPLALNQVAGDAKGRPESAAAHRPQAAMEAPAGAGMSGGVPQNTVRQTETDYMDELHRSREQRKYDVRII